MGLFFMCNRLLGGHRSSAGSSTVFAEQASATPRPNILLVVIDDLGWADLGCYGADLHTTPHIDKFAASAVRFTAAYASGESVPRRGPP